MPIYLQCEIPKLYSDNLRGRASKKTTKLKSLFTMKNSKELSDNLTMELFDHKS